MVTCRVQSYFATVSQSVSQSVSMCVLHVSFFHQNLHRECHAVYKRTVLSFQHKMSLHRSTSIIDLYRSHRSVMNDIARTSQRNVRKNRHGVTESMSTFSVTLYPVLLPPSCLSAHHRCSENRTCLTEHSCGSTSFKLSTTLWRRSGVWMYSSTYSWPRH
jgi:hypothetical protein